MQVSEVQYVTVTALTRYIKRKFDVDPHLRDIWIKGEISNFKRHSRGHMYFTLKDESARMQSVMFAANNRSLAFQPQEGMKVMVRGEVAVYEPSGNYQVYVKEMQPDGIGSLYLAYEQLKERLEKEGLFSPQYKKSIPAYPTCIGVITSPTGAAVRDIMTTLRRRYPVARVILIPALVQGVKAGPSIIEAIQKANEMDMIDTLIVGRGGGSIEELWAFNEEEVARAIFQSHIPIISAVGHETDFTIADFVADLRAPTPTGAAELAVPHLSEVMERLKQRNIRMMRAVRERMTASKERLKNAQKSYAFRYPQRLLEQKEQDLDRMMDRLHKEMGRALQAKIDAKEALTQRLKRNHPQEKIKQAHEHTEMLTKSLSKEMQNLLKQKQLLFGSLASKLDALSPLKTMERGYSLVYNEENELVKSTKNITTGDKVNIRLTDGQIECEVAKVEER
ncbi:exodeoxyribonuclease VII large subunit [Priestia koreensis]|nr:exodeoxyribonuclease VII large subunit [Priestia koreensis]MCM3002421.1 exodeoxyribonuclease VII large subunit [Priestia koreensis]UNL84145.1 exodeoxyribonuclease VII large subunit [Priestia koreensis]